MWLLFIALSATNVTPPFNRWELSGDVPFELQIARMEKGIGDIRHEDQSVPDSFDAREHWPHCRSIGEIVEQRRCGSCWAIAPASAMTDRWCIVYNETFVFSAEDILTCCYKCINDITLNHCESGGSSVLATKFWLEVGVVSGGPLGSGLGCKPYSEKTAAASPPECALRCSNPKYQIPYDQDKRRGGGIRLWDNITPIKQIQIEIMLNGPVFACMRMTKHFEWNISEEVYIRPFGTKFALFAHAVKIIGWGIEKNVSYWLVANSWGKRWGKMEGFFKIRRGTNEMGIENAVFAPDVVPSSQNVFSYNVLHVCAYVIMFYLGVAFI